MWAIVFNKFSNTELMSAMDRQCSSRWENVQLRISSSKANKYTTLRWTGISIWASAKLCHTA